MHHYGESAVELSDDATDIAASAIGDIAIVGAIIYFMPLVVELVIIQICNQTAGVSATGNIAGIDSIGESKVAIRIDILHISEYVTSFVRAFNICIVYEIFEG